MKQLFALLVISSCLGASGCAGGFSWFKRGQTDVLPQVDVAASTERGSRLSALPRDVTDNTAAATAAAMQSQPSIAELKAKAKSKPINKVSAKDKAKFARLFSKARGFEAEKKSDEARAIYEQLIVQFPERAEAYHRLAVVADRQRRHREAEALYAEALRREPMNGKFLGDLGYCYFLQGKLTKAESALSKALAVEPAEVRHRNNLGLVYGHQGKTAEALESFRRAGSEADAQFNLAFVLASQDRGEEAKQCFHAALLADPAHEKSYEALAAFERYESTPEELRDDFGDGAADGRWVAYVEGAGDTSHVAPAAAIGGKGQVLQARARQMMSARAAVHR